MNIRTMSARKTPKKHPEISMRPAKCRFGVALKKRYKGASVNIFYVPALILLGAFVLYPLLDGFLLSLTNWDGYSPERAFVGVKNYKTMFVDPNFPPILINTFIYGVGSTLIQQVIGLALALMLNEKIRGRAFMRALIYLPVLVAPVIMGTMYYFVFQYRQGALNAIVTALGFEKIDYFSHTGVSLGIVVIVNSLQFVGVSMIIYLAGLQTFDQSVIEAARIDGASGVSMLRSITLPLLRPAFTTSVVLNLIGGLKLYDLIIVLTGGGPGYSTHSMSTYISSTYFDNQQAGYASAIGVLLFVTIAIVTLTMNKILQRSSWEA